MDLWCNVNFQVQSTRILLLVIMGEQVKLVEMDLRKLKVKTL